MELTEKPIKQMIFRVPEPIQRQFKSLAALAGKTMTEILIEWVKMAAKNQPKTPEDLLKLAKQTPKFQIRTFSKKEKKQFLKDDQL
jgi:hypothetical protein